MEWNPVVQFRDTDIKREFEADFLVRFAFDGEENGESLLENILSSSVCNSRLLNGFMFIYICMVRMMA